MANLHTDYCLISVDKLFRLSFIVCGHCGQPFEEKRDVPVIRMPLNEKYGCQWVGLVSSFRSYM